MRFIISLFAAMIGLVTMASNNATLITFTSISNTGLTDSIANAYSQATDHTLDTIKIIFPAGKIEQGVEQFKTRLSSLPANIKDNGYFILGLGLDGSAAATISASQTAPEGLILLSGAGIDGSKVVTRIMTGLSYIHDFPAEVRVMMRKEVEKYTSSEPFDTIEPIMPEEMRELVKFQPKKYLNKLTCPVFAAYGTADPLVDWYENSTGLDEALPFSESNKIKTFFYTGYGLVNSELNTNIPQFGDFKPTERSFNTSAIAEIADWMKTIRK